MHARPPQPVGGPAPPPPPGSLGGLPTPATQPPHYSQHYASQYHHQQPPRAVNGTAMPGQMIAPSHPSHPQHAAWIAHHHHQQQLAAAQGLPNPPPHLQGPPPSATSTRMAHAAAAANGGTAAPYGSTFVQIPPPPSPVGASPRLPPGQVQPLGGGGGMHPSAGGMPLSSQHQQQQQHGQYHHHGQQQQIAPPPRTIPSGAGIRPLSSLATSPPHGNHHNPNASPFPQYAISASNSQSPALGHRQSISGGPLPPPPPPASFGGQPQQQAGPRQHFVRQSFAPQPNTLLAARVAVNGTGPITATSAPSGPALSRLAALNEAIQLALESDSPLEALRIAVADHFTDTGVVKIGLFDSATPMSKVFEIPCSAFPRFQHINHLLGAISSTFQPCLVREFRLTTPDPSNPPPRPASPLTGGPPPPPPSATFPAVHIGYLLRSEDAIWSSRFHDGARVDLRGALTLHLMFKDLGNGAAGLRIESLEFDARGFEESVSRSVLANLERALSAAMADATSAKAALKAAAVVQPSTSDDTVTAKDEEAEHNANGSSRRRGASAKAQQQARGMNTRRRSAATKAELVTDDALPTGEGGSGATAAAQDSKTPSASSTTATATGTASENKAHNGDAAVEALRDRVAPSPVGAFGVTEMGMRCLEIAESVAQLQNLIAFSLESGFGPIDALARYADMHRSGVFAPPSDRGHAAAAAAAAAASAGTGPGPGGGGEGMYNGPGPVQQAFAAHPGLGGDIGGTSLGPGPEMVSLKRGAPPPPLSMPNSAAIEMMDRDLPSPQKVPRVTAGRGRGRGR